MTQIEHLAQRQLDAYNQSDLDAFVACYHPEVIVMDGGEQTVNGIDDFRSCYRALFDDWQFGATVPQRISLKGHCIDFEEWWRIDPTTGERSEGQLLVHYKERDGLISSVEFLS